MLFYISLYQSGMKIYLKNNCDRSIHIFKILNNRHDVG